ncbi:WYL domain-containing protein [Paenibacillus sp. N3/727]|uniref:WYL domain-containing protein n=1 Tax=Paenibacillus sp. N3/727 TaxID=2925845 RepID=UPI001F53A7B4|nr:WYL domain-containing protein [Paenibacillus sp. N3/727]UNK17198.1 WYL domain-containing protein [Paenibacillus sp. N3/727]
MIPRDQRFYQIGYCHLAEDIRTFRLSRFRQVEITSDTYVKGDFSIKQYMKLNRACTECGPVMNVLVYPLVFSRN